MIPTPTVAVGGVDAPPRPAARLLAAGRDQAIVAGGQLAAGVGNLAFVAVLARMLPASSFGQVASFVALLTILHLPGAGLAAMSAMTPDRSNALLRRALAVGAVGGAVMTVLSAPLATTLGLPRAFVLALAAAAPAAPALGLQRGRAYGTRSHRPLVLSLLAEPCARLGAGLTAAVLWGATGAVWGAAAGGWLALAALRSVRAAPAQVDGSPIRRGQIATSVAFMALAVLQHQDLIVATRVLDGPDAGAIAALSAIGGVVAFATATVPLVLLPAARSGDDPAAAIRVALGITLAVAAGAVALALLAADLLVVALVGRSYTPVVPLVAPYLFAMGALGTARVIAAHRCAQGEGRSVAVRVAAVAGAHLVTVAAVARTPGQVVGLTLVALVTLTGVLVLPVGEDAATVRTAWRERVAGWWARPDVPLLVALTLVAIALRMATERSFWVDEAISVRQARLPMGEMLHDLRTTDVHPPLHFLVLWVSARVLGTAEWAVRMPSVIFGAALVPVLYGAAREAFDRRTARVAAALAVPAPFLVWYSQEARMYALFMLVGVLSVWAQLAALKSGRWSAFVAWGAASAALMWTQWFAILPIATQQIVTVAYLWRRRGWESRPPLAGRWLGALGVMAVLIAPLVPFLLDQLAAYSERGAGLSMPAAAGADSSSVASGLSSYAVIANLMWAMAGYHGDDVMVRLGAVWPLAMLGGLMLLGRRLTWTTGVLLSVALVPGALLFAIAHTKRDLFELRYFVLAAPLLLIVAARTVTTLARTRTALSTSMVALLLASSGALLDQQLNGTNPRLYDFRGAVGAIRESASPGDVLAYAPGYLDGVLGYYAPEMDGLPLGSIRPHAVEGQIYVVVAERFLTEASAGRIGDELARLEAARGAPIRFERPNVVVWRFR